MSNVIREECQVVTFTVSKVINRLNAAALFAIHLDDTMMEIEVAVARILRERNVPNNAVGIEISLHRPTPDEVVRIQEAIAAANDLTEESQE